MILLPGSRPNAGPALKMLRIVICGWFYFSISLLTFVAPMRSTGIRYSALILGILVALSIAFSSASQSQAKKVKAKSEQTSKEDDSSSTEVPPVLSVTSLPSPTVIHFNHAVVCIFEIIFIEVQSSNFAYIESVCDNKFFATLLQVIISPNAP